MPTGRVLRFDEARGYGFITVGGSSDIFFHANELDCARERLRPGARVSFETAESDRGVRAFSVRVVDGGCSADDFGRELAELLTGDLPLLTAAEIARLRERIVALAKRRSVVSG